MIINFERATCKDYHIDLINESTQAIARVYDVNDPSYREPYREVKGGKTKGDEVTDTIEIDRLFREVRVYCERGTNPRLKPNP